MPAQSVDGYNERSACPIAWIHDCLDGEASVVILNRRWRNQRGQTLRSTTGDITVDELLEIMRQVDCDAPGLEPNCFNLNETPIERKGSHYGMLVVARYEKQRNRYMDDLALQVSNAVMGATDSPRRLWSLGLKYQ